MTQQLHEANHQHDGEYRIFRQMMPEKLNSDGLPNKEVTNKAKNTALLVYNKTPIKCYGVIDLQCNHERGDRRCPQPSSVWVNYGLVTRPLHSTLQCGYTNCNAAKEGKRYFAC